jgi:ubiquinone/menaquinone biosynthesis C-methylase UbiE/DNA-binding transcriptional ArsR family regulator
LETLLHVMRAVAEPTRLRLLALCSRSELTVTELTQILGQSQPRVSRHLKLLVEAGVLDRFREGTWAFYRLSDIEPCAALTRLIVAHIPEDDETRRLDLQRLDGVKAARAEAAAAYFRQNAVRWSDVRSCYVEDREIEKSLLQLLPSADVSDLLDIGTGTGRILELYGSTTDRAVGIDLSREMLAVARANLETAGYANCQVRQGDMYQLPAPSESFGAAIIHMVLHYADSPGAVIAEAARVLRDGGRLVIVDFAPHREESLRVDHAHRRLGFSVREVDRWCRRANLVPDTPVHLPGDPLTVTLWSATKPDAPAETSSAERELAVAPA